MVKANDSSAVSRVHVRVRIDGMIYDTLVVLSLIYLGPDDVVKPTQNDWSGVVLAVEQASCIAYRVCYRGVDAVYLSIFFNDSSLRKRF